MKKKNIIIPITALIIGLSSCGGTSSSGKTSVTIGDDYYDTVGDRVGLDTTNPINFKENFVNGMSDDTWFTVDGAWHTEDPSAPHNGVRSRNLFYTNKEGKNYLAIKGRGMYNRESDTIIGRPEGGAIISKNHLGPGRYEIKMAAMPRAGGVTAMWTYCTTTGNEETSQNEIDIEIGGTTNGSQFENFWATSWTKRGTKETQTIDVTENLFMNDGKIHTYTFDWYTNFLGSHERRVDWFIDGKHIQTLTGDVVPEYDMPLWVGVWFPPLWSGVPNFDVDYLLIEEVSYTSFDTTQPFDECRAYAGYIKQIPSQVGIQTISMDSITNINKISNSNFENLDVSSRDSSYYGWVREGVSKGTTTLSSESTQGSHSYNLTAGSGSGDNNGEYLGQRITNAYEGFKYKLSIDAKKMTADAEGNIELYFRNKGGSVIGSPVTLPIESTNFASYSYDITMPEGGFTLEIVLTSEKGSILYDNASLVYLGVDY